MKEVDYKDIGTLSKLTTNQGKMFSRKRSGNCAKHQRSTERAVKRARFLGLMPYVG
ncbi:MAG: 30S ribosomal protein S18 [Phycisphaerae bacterium]|nr:30S ribosomal protein S18 [Phycisphaerae bacterium]